MFWHCEIEIGIAKLALRNFRIANLVLRKFSHCEIAFGTAKLARLLRSAQCPAATVPLLLHPAASHPVFNCISFSSLCLGFSFDLWVV